MKKLLNTLYILTDDIYLSLNGETVDALYPDGSHKAIPLHTLDGIVCFSYKGASPALMGKCAEKGIMLSFFSPRGKYLADTGNSTNGNVYLRRTQYRWADDEERSIPIVKNMITGKIFNSKYLILHYLRDHPYQVDETVIRNASGKMSEYIEDIKTADSIERIRGIEGNAAAEYFGVINELILQNKEVFVFNGRNRRPPTDPVNCLLSFAYSMLSNDCASALRSVGLDPYVGFMHTDRPGRCSLALDLMEELRSVLADRFVLSMINNRVMDGKDFLYQETGAIILEDEARRRFITNWQNRKKDEITHPYLKEKMSWGLVPYAQALLLSRYLRGDIDGYPPFLWK